MYDNRSTERLGIESSVNMSEFRKSPTRYILDSPVAVLSRRKPIGYLVDAELFEMLLGALAQHENPATMKKELGLTDGWLRAVT